MLETLTRAHGGAGQEDEAMRAAQSLLSHYAKTQTDAMGNLYGRVQGQGPHILLDAHMDEISLIVTHVDEKGFLKVSACGGMDARILLGSSVTVYGKAPLPGIVCTLPPHLSKDMDKVPSIEEMAVDVGLNATQAQAQVKPGNRVFLRKSLTPLQNGRVTGKSLDDRAGIATILRALELLRQQKVEANLTVLFSVQEEVGTRGAKPAAFRCEPEEAVAVDVSFAASPGTPAHKCGKLSDGPMIGIAPVLAKRMSDRMIALCAQEGIPYQLEVMGGTTGTNADVFTISKIGIPTALLSLPLRYMHTGVEVVDLADLENTARLLAAYIRTRGEDAQ